MIAVPYTNFVGECVMPREGIFGKVIEGGTIGPADGIYVIKNN
jgi:hypothetical protein